MRKTIIVLLSSTLLSATTSCSQPPKNEAPPITSDTEIQEKTYPTPGQVFLKAKLKELDNILKTPEYEKYKWSQAGPYPEWPQKLQAEKDLNNDFSMYEKSGIAMLSNLAIEYAYSNKYGIETSRKHVEEVINAKP